MKAATPVPEGDYLDDDFELEPEGDEEFAEPNAVAGEDALADHDLELQEEPAMGTQNEQPDAPVRIKGGVRGDDDKAADAAPEDHMTGKERQEALLDEGVEETFPASDPVSVKHIT